ncbi:MULTISPECIES: LolA family protein [Solibacillus]|uniref:LolA family protein n=1 Tax=Solibacillus TaxID=648800 RepID=UPI0020424256|nr:outer membrane lipoprotein carrier protein LolA [Solibacillus isronensis]MCM3723805.1 outer membrane lipoprotein carrier protein LolA [Solibacillus isronensis]
MKLRLLVVVVCCLFLAACGKATKDEVIEDVNKKWNDAKGYELSASMEVRTGAEPRVYDVKVWHTKPDFYRVAVNPKGESEQQLIVRNEEGVFVVTPSLRKTHKFQSEWPKQNSQAYIIGALADDLVSDSKAVMTEDDASYTFEVATRNVDQTALPVQQIVIDKKTMLPTKVSVMDESLQEQVVITFADIKLGVKHTAEEYAVEKFTEKEEKKAASAEVADTEFSVYYPTIDWAHTKLTDEFEVQEDGNTRVILTFEGEKPFTLMQQPIQSDETILPVSGDPADLGYTIGAITDNSIQWDKDGMTFFIASTKLTKDELLEVAASVQESSIK